MKELYNTIFKRKSIRKYEKNQFLSADELNMIFEKTKNLVSLIDDIKYRMDIVKKEETTAKFGEYALLMYSEIKPHYLLNCGYLLEQMDLFMESKNIGVCWYALAKPKLNGFDNLNYVIMLVFGKCLPDKFRTKISEFKRKRIDEFWQGEFETDILEAIRLAPSACNTQPWRFKYNDKIIKVYRSTKIKSFIPQSKLPYYNSIDMGISICFLEICLQYKNYQYARTIINNDKGLDLVEIAQYEII